jgi:hypothetical protein
MLQTRPAQSRRRGIAALAARQTGRVERANKLVFVPAVNPNVLDLVVAGIRSTRDHAYLVFDTL